MYKDDLFYTDKELYKSLIDDYCKSSLLSFADAEKNIAHSKEVMGGKSQSSINESISLMCTSILNIMRWIFYSYEVPLDTQKELIPVIMEQITASMNTVTNREFNRGEEITLKNAHSTMYMSKFD